MCTSKYVCTQCPKLMYFVVFHPKTPLRPYMFKMPVFCHSRLHSQQRFWTERHTLWIIANEVLLMACSNVQSYLLPVFVVLWRIPGSLLFPKVEIKGLKMGRWRPEIRSSTSSSYPSLIECAIEKISHIGMKVAQSPFFMELKLIFILKVTIKTWKNDFQP